MTEPNRLGAPASDRTVASSAPDFERELIAGSEEAPARSGVLERSVPGPCRPAQRSFRSSELSVSARESDASRG